MIDQRAAQEQGVCEKCGVPKGEVPSDQWVTYSTGSRRSGTWYLLGERCLPCDKAARAKRAG